MNTIQNSIHYRLLEKNTSKLKRIHNIPLGTIYESTGDIPQPATNDSPPGQQNRIRDRSLNSSIVNLLKVPERLSPTSAMMHRTSSLSPARKTTVEESLSKKKLRLPMPGTQAGLLYSEFLTKQEAKEIDKYQEVYFLGEKKNKSEKNYTDEEGRYKSKVNDQIAFRYEIIEKLGKGTFGNVYKCWDHKRNGMVAIKIMRNVTQIRLQGEIEIENLEKIAESDPEDIKCIVKMKQCFEFRGHICISFEILSSSLYHFLRNNEFQGLSTSLIKRIAFQVLIGLRHIHALGFIHCDLKPENILFKHENKSSIKIIDFGSATYKCARAYSTYIQSRYYRAPEIILGLGYDNKIDIWSFGCILFELFSGTPLFAGESENDQIIKIMAVLGTPPEYLIKRAKRKKEFFQESHRPILLPDSKGQVLVPNSRVLEQQIEDHDFCSFLKKCLEWDPQQRFSADEALKQPWIKNNPQKNLRSRNRYEL